MPSKGSEQVFKEEETQLLVPAQQPAGLSRQEPHASSKDQVFSQDQMQAMVDLVFKAGFMHMGQLAHASMAEPALTDQVSAAESASVPEQHHNESHHAHAEPDNAHYALQQAFNQLVAHGLQRQQPSRSRNAITSGNASDTANAAAAAAATTTACSGVATPTESTAAPATTSASRKVAGAAARQQDETDGMPKRLVGRERARVARFCTDQELPRFHSVYSDRDHDGHATEIKELVDCRRQVGFAAPGALVDQRPSWRVPAVRMLLALAGVLIAGLTSSRLHGRSRARADDLSPHSEPDTSDSDLDF